MAPRPRNAALLHSIIVYHYYFFHYRYWLLCQLQWLHKFLLFVGVKKLLKAWGLILVLFKIVGITTVIMSWLTCFINSGTSLTPTILLLSLCTASCMTQKTPLGTIILLFSKATEISVQSTGPHSYLNPYLSGKARGSKKARSRSMSWSLIHLTLSGLRKKTR